LPKFLNNSPKFISPIDFVFVELMANVNSIFDKISSDGGCVRLAPAVPIGNGVLDFVQSNCKTQDQDCH